MASTSNRPSNIAPSRRLTALMSLLWLNLAMLPCAMALEQQQNHGCPGCAPSNEVPMDAHHGHDMKEPAVDCEVTQGDCCDLDEISLDDRNQKSPHDKAEKTAPSISIAGLPSLAEVRADNPPTGPPDPGRGAQRLHVLYCVYLD